MQQVKKIGIYLALAAVLALLLLMALFPFWEDCLSSAVTGKQTIKYTAAAANSDGTVYAVGQHNGIWKLACGTAAKGRQKLQPLNKLGIYDVVMADKLGACADGAVLSVYEQGDDLFCKVYYLPAGTDKAVMIYSAVCEKGSRDDVKVDGITETGGIITFLLRKNGVAEAFCYTPGEDSARQIQKLTEKEADSALFALPDGEMALFDDGCLFFQDETVVLPEYVFPAAAWRITDGVSLLNGADGAFWRVDMNSGRNTKLLGLDKISGVDVTAVSVSPDGAVLMLTDGGELLVWRDEIARDHSQILYRARWQSILILVLSAIGILLLALALWYFLWEHQKMQLSMVIKKGLVIGVILGLMTTGAVRWVVAPYFEEQAAAEAKRYLSVVALDKESSDVKLLKLTDIDGNLYLEGVEEESQTALSVLMRGTAYRQGAKNALQSGEAFAKYTVQGVPYYAYFIKTAPNRLTAVSAESGIWTARAEQGRQKVERLLWIGALTAEVLVLAALWTLRGSLQRVIAGMDALHAGKPYVEVVNSTGDETGAMADSLNALAQTMRKSGEADIRRGDLYTRFLPSQIVQLLGVESVEQIDKQTFAYRKMTTMHVSFSFDEKVYESRSKELFDNINEVTECTAKIVSARGGTILSFSHEGFDALFAPEGDEPISAAVAICQEISSINRSRQKQNYSPVALHIALDTGEVMLGVVGDDTRMQTTAVSSSFNTTRMLTSLFDKFDANILCTERIERRANGYGHRYIGKSHDGSELIRVYEIYDGDTYTVRQGKAEMEKRFSEGVYTLYTGDYAEAKRIFMEIARQNSEDGVAKYYLYLADRFDKEAPGEVCLDF